MKKTSLLRLAAAGTAAGTIAAFGAAGSAPAVDDTKPVPTCAGLAFKDPAGDHGSAAVLASATTGSTDIVDGFLKHEPAKGDQATTYNLTVKDLKAQVPSGYTTMAWNMYYRTTDDVVRSVRAIVDFSGAVAWEATIFTPNPTGVGVSGVTQYDRETTGKFFEGPNGVVQIVIPAAYAKPGAK